MDTSRRNVRPNTVTVEGVDLVLAATYDDFPNIEIGMSSACTLLAFSLTYREAVRLGDEILGWVDEEEPQGAFGINWDSVASGEGRLTIVNEHGSKIWMSIQMVEDFDPRGDDKQYAAWSAAFREHMRPFAEWLKTIGAW